MAEIRLTGINKVYPGGTHAVHDVDLHIADGEFMIMVGPSGCAKSTILRMIAGLETPTTGTMEIGGRVVNDVAPKDRDIAMVFQSYALYPHMTVRENMAFGLRLRKMPPTEIDQRVAEAARILGLEQLLDRLPKAMSGGQRQRVAMGRAIVREPQAFLMDEPLSNLDAKLRVQMRTEIAKLHQRLGTTTVYVTHDQVEAMTLGQRICILRKGVVQQVDTPFEVYNNPANVFVGGFIGSPGMNFMNGHLVLHDGILYVQLGDHHFPVPASVTSRLLATHDLHGRGVIVGLRPEHMAQAAPNDPAAMLVQVELVEAMGAEVYAYFQAAVTSPDLTHLSDTQASMEGFVARLTSGTDARGGEQVWLRPDMDEVHLFDPQTMLTMLSPSLEADVKARHSGTAQAVAANRVGAATSPVAMPPQTAAAMLHPHQQLVQAPTPVIHLHQTFMQPEPAVAHGRLAEADPRAISAVFDQPAARHQAGAVPMAMGGSGGLTVEPLTAAPLPPSPFSSRLRPAAAGGSGTAGSVYPRPSFHDAFALRAEGLEADAAPSEPPPSEDADAPPPAEPARRGFMARVIGPGPTGTKHREASAEPAAAEPDPAPAPTGLSVTDADLDTAIGSLDGASEGAEPVDVHATIDAPTAVDAHAAVASPVAPRSTAFRDALFRVRAAQTAPAPSATSAIRVTPPTLRLSPAHGIGGPSDDAAEHPSTNPPSN